MITFTEMTFRTCDQVRLPLQEICAANPELASFHELGLSEEGRPIDAVIMGTGPRRVSLIAGAHSDEPVGPETLRAFILQGLSRPDVMQRLLQDFTFVIIPQINPDGEAKNQDWIKAWPDVESYLRHVFREPPGRDLEFGFPEMRVENRCVARFLRRQAPFHLHMSLHGMGIADGAMLLIEKHWIPQSKWLRGEYSKILTVAGLQLHDHDRRGEKGFQYIGPGFTTTPEGQAMQAYFRSIGDEQTARQFHLSSMEYVRSLGGDPLCLVTELPLFYIQMPVSQPEPGVPGAYREFKKTLPQLREKLARGETIQKDLQRFQITHLPLDLLANLQFQALRLGLKTIQQNR